MKYFKKSLSFIFVLFLMFLVSCVFSSCSNNIVVSLYDGDTLIKKVNVSVDKSYDFGTLEKTGYTFIGWYNEDVNGTAYTDQYGTSAGMMWKASNSTTVYAHWDANKYKIELDYCGATSNNQENYISVVYDELIKEKLPVPKKTGYTFIGWYTEKTNGVQITDASGNLLENAEIYNNSIYHINGETSTIYAHWTDKIVTYTFVTGDGTSVEKVSYPVGTVLYELPYSTKDNHCFVSWCFDSTLMTPLTFPYIVNDNSGDEVMLYANFVPGILDLLQFTTISSTNDKAYEVTYNGNASKIVIPDMYYGKKVTRVKRITSSTVEEIILPQTINEFSNGAFEKCTSLKKINIPSAIRTISEKCFSGCSSLTGITIPQNVSVIGKEAFSGCLSIKQINLPKNINTINSGAFRNMASLEKFIIDDSNEKYMVKEDVLYYKVGVSYYLVQYPASKKEQTYEIDSATVKIMEYAFSSSQISSITIGGKISSIEKGAFENCINLVNVDIHGSSITFAIDADAFKNCVNLKAMKIELSKVPTLHETALTGLSKTFSIYVASNMIRMYQTAASWRTMSSQIYALATIFGDFAVEEVNGGYAIRQYFGTDKEVVIPEILNAHKIVEISENAFSFSNIEKVTISQYVNKIGDNAFANCSLLKNIVMESKPPILGNDVFKNISNDFDIYIKGTADVLELYKSADKWKELSSHIWTYQ